MACCSVETDTNALGGQRADSPRRTAVRSAAAQEASALGIIHSEKFKCKWECSAVPLIIASEEKNEVVAKGIGNDKETGEKVGNTGNSTEDVKVHIKHKFHSNIVDTMMDPTES